MKIDWRYFQRAILGAVLFSLPVVTMAETLMMPDREGLVGEDVVVWGATDQVGNYTLDCGNGTTDIAAVGDGSYIPFVCNYASEGTFTASLTVGGESDTADVGVFDAAGLSAFDERGVRINMAIEDGLRWLWVNQSNRAGNFPASTVTEWPGSFWVNPFTSFVVLAFENQGYRLSNDNVAPTDIYEKYVVRRGINRILTNLSTINIGPQAAGDPCVGLPIDGEECIGLYENRHDEFHQSYATGVATLALAGSGATARTNTEVAGFTNGRTYGEILQRMSNALVFGQIEPAVGFPAGASRGGWYYNFNSSSSDGSTVGWVLLALLDAEAAGATVPAFAKSEHAFAVDGSLNDDGSYDYQGNGDPASNSNVGIEKGGVGLQGLFYSGELVGPRVAAVEQYLSDRWNGGPNTAFSTVWGCGPTAFVAPFDNNHGCAYSMYNAFKGLKLIGTQTLPGVGRAAGPGTIPANDWHEDYKDWLVANQTNPTTTTGGNWSTMQFSSIDNTDAANAAIAELILSPVALVFPDPVQFGELGLQHCLDGVPCTDRTPTAVGEPTEDTNPVGTDHNVVARALSINDDPIPGTTINIDILSGPNAPANFQGVSNANGEVQIQYTSNGVAGTDEIQASIGNLTSNLLTKVWEADVEPQVCDVDGDGDVDRSDTRAILRARNNPATGPDDPMDANGDGWINSLDAKLCTAQCTLPRCASPAP